MKFSIFTKPCYPLSLRAVVANDWCITYIQHTGAVVVEDIGGLDMQGI